MSAEKIIEIENLSKTFGKIQAVDNLSILWLSFRI